MKNWGFPEIIARQFLHICQNFRGICKSIKNYIFGLENNLYLKVQHLILQLIPTFIIHTLGSFWWGSHYDIMCEKLHIWINYGGVFPSNLPILQFGYCFFYPNYLCVNNEDKNCINSSPKMSFLMLLQISLKFWQMCKNSLAIISGTPQFFIRHVNNTRGKWNCHCRLTLRLTGRQGRCG